MPDYKLENHYGLTVTVILALRAAGYRTPGEIRVLSDETLLAIDGIGESEKVAIRAALGAQL